MELKHYGIKGQKWGVRRFQNEDGTLTDLGKSRNRAIKMAQTKDKVDSIYKSLSKQEKHILGGDMQSKEWLSLDEGENVAKRFIKEVGNKPVAFLDIIEAGSKYDDGGYRYEIAIATRSGRKNRGKGYATELGRQAVDWINKHPKIMDKEVVWLADPDNTASNKLATKLGFKYDEKESSKKWDNVYKLERKGV